jgi:hypothetical protein
LCIKTPKPPKAQNTGTPQRDENAAMVVAARQRAVDQGGVNDNIFTSALGDSAYNTSASSPALARFAA